MQTGELAEPRAGFVRTSDQVEIGALPKRLVQHDARKGEIVENVQFTILSPVLR